jgi:hypothetical protein
VVKQSFIYAFPRTLTVLGFHEIVEAIEQVIKPVYGQHKHAGSNYGGYLDPRSDSLQSLI